MPRHTNISRRGFILVMTLMLLAIAAVALVATGRASMGLAVDAVRARQDLQRRWGNTSSRHAVLQLAPVLMKSAGDHPSEPQNHIRAQVQLNGDTYSFTLSDEQAKANVNTMLHYHGREGARTYIRRQCGSQPWADEITLPTAYTQTDADEPDGAEKPRREIISINHFLPAFDPSRFDHTDGYPLGTLTCWGDGKVNLIRAPDDIVQSVLKPLLGTTEIIKLRETLVASNSQSLMDALQTTGVSEKEAPKILERLTSESNCYALWVVIDNGKRRWHELAVLELRLSDPDESQRTESEQAAGTTDIPDTDPQGITQPVTPPVLLDETTQETTTQGPTDPQDDSDTYPRIYLYHW